jgi:hypothetical protein
MEIFALLTLFVAVLKALSLVFDPVRRNQPELVLPRDKNIVAALADEENSSDVLIVGDSEAMVLVSPRFLWMKPVYHHLTVTSWARE